MTPSGNSSRHVTQYNPKIFRFSVSSLRGLVAGKTSSYHGHGSANKYLRMVKLEVFTSLQHMFGDFWNIRRRHEKPRVSTHDNPLQREIG